VLAEIVQARDEALATQKALADLELREARLTKWHLPVPSDCQSWIVVPRFGVIQFAGTDASLVGPVAAGGS
jgi:hypothetical protein